MKGYIPEGSTWEICVSKTNDSLKNERSKDKKKTVLKAATNAEATGLI